jgi:hypothetical protein
LSKVTVEDFRSEDWHKISPEGVEEYLKMKCLDVEEADLARALISWGRFQVHAEGGDSADSARLRSKILPGLRWIRFAVLDQDEFTQLCRQELGAVLSEEEKNSIIKAITSSKQTLLRPAVEKRSRPPTVFNLPCVQHCNQIAPEGLFRANLIFHLDKSAAFIGLNVVSSTVAAYGSFTFEIYNAHNFTTIGRGGSEEKKISYYGEDYYQINPKGTLTAGDKYNLTFTFPRIFPNSMHLNYPYVTLPLNTFTHNGLTLTIDSTVFHVLVKSMMFVKSP